MNETHPVFVKKTELLSGVGTPCVSRTGGMNTETIRSPTKTPTNNHNSDIITLNLYILLRVRYLENQIYYAWDVVRETNNAKVCFISANSDSNVVTLLFKDLTAETR